MLKRKAYGDPQRNIKSLQANLPRADVQNDDIMPGLRLDGLEIDDVRHEEGERIDRNRNGGDVVENVIVKPIDNWDRSKDGMPGPYKLSFFFVSKCPAQGCPAEKRFYEIDLQLPLYFLQFQGK